MENEKTMEHTEHTAENTPGEAAPQPEENLREVPAGASFGENSADTAQADPSHVGLAPEAGSPAGDTPPAEKAARCAAGTKTTIGGQALIEGIYMRGPRRSATVVRRGDGSHAVREEENKSLKDRFFLFNLPFIRGIFVFGTAIKSGISQIMYSVEASSDGEEQELSGFDAWLEKKLGRKGAERLAMGVGAALGVAMPVLLFILLPTFLAGLIPYPAGALWLRSVAEGVLRLLIFLGFIYSTAQMKDMKRVYGFHGAEHKAIHCYEAGLPLTVENVRVQTRKHPRCGTSFMFVIIIISILVFSFISTDSMWLRLALRIVLLPVVVNIGYEFNRVIGRHDNFFTKALRAPGIWLQNLTTNEPDGVMIRVAIDALERVIPEQSGEDAW